MLKLLLRLHIAVKAYVVKWLRTRFILKQFKLAHAQEITETPMNFLPIVLARHSSEIDAVRAGKIDIASVTAAANNGIIDRRSWQWPFLPATVNRLATPMLKSTPYNIRRMSRTPVPRRAMNIIKGAMISQPWEIRPIADVDPIDSPEEQAERIKIATKIFSHPNNDDSFQTFIEQGMEDQMVLGAFVAELRLTLDPERPVKMWPVVVESIRLLPDWQESTPDKPRYAQMTGLKGERGAQFFYDDQMLYIKDNISTDNPFGLGKMEVVFQSLNSLLGVQQMAGMAGADTIHKSWLWFEQPQSDAAMQILRRHIQNEMEGQAKISLIAGMKKPDVIDVTPVNIADLLIPWQEMCIRMVANGFDMSAMALGVEHDVNRAVGQVLDDKDFRTAVIPPAKRLMTGFTRRILHDLLRWWDLEFAFLDLDDPDLETKIAMHAKLYSMNATTPNRILKALHMQPLENDFADLTQFQCMLLNIQAMQINQDTLAQHAMQRQQNMQQSQPQQPGGPQGAKPLSPGSVARGGQPPSPKPLSLPKFPIASSIYSAQQIAKMPINRVQDVYINSGMSAGQFLEAMDQQEPGILQALDEQVKQYFEEQLDKDEQKPKTKLSPKTLKKWKKELAVAFRKDNRRPMGNLPVGMAGRPNAGMPGNMNPIRKG